MFILKDVKKSFVENGMRVDAVRGASYRFPERGLVCIVGRSGSGKSTLLKLLAGLDSPTEGEIIFCEKEIGTLSERKRTAYRRNHVGIIFQEQNLFSELTVKDNIEFFGEAESGLAEKLGIGELLSRKTNELSGGQLQRAAIARTLTQDPDVILADEPTGALDENTGKEIFRLLKEVSASKLVIVVTHDRASAEEFADEIITMKDGRTEAAEPTRENAERISPQAVRNRNPRINKLGIRFFWADKVKAVLCTLICVLSACCLLLTVCIRNYDGNRAVCKFLTENVERYPILVSGSSFNREESEYVQSRCDALPFVSSFWVADGADELEGFGFAKRTACEPLGEDGFYFDYGNMALSLNALGWLESPKVTIYEYEKDATSGRYEYKRDENLNVISETYYNCIVLDDGTEVPLNADPLENPAISERFTLNDLNGFVGKTFKLYAFFMNNSIAEKRDPASVPALVCKGVVERKWTYADNAARDLSIDYVIGSKNPGAEFANYHDYEPATGTQEAVPFGERRFLLRTDSCSERDLIRFAEMGSDPTQTHRGLQYTSILNTYPYLVDSDLQYGNNPACAAVREQAVAIYKAYDALNILGYVFLLLYLIMPSVMVYLELRKKRRAVITMRALGVSCGRTYLTLLFGVGCILLPVFVLGVLGVFPMVGILNGLYGVSVEATFLSLFYFNANAFLWAGLFLLAGFVPVLLVPLSVMSGKNFAKEIRAE